MATAVERVATRRVASEKRMVGFFQDGAREIVGQRGYVSVQA